MHVEISVGGGKIITRIVKGLGGDLQKSRY